jgi:dihydroorotase
MSATAYRNARIIDPASDTDVTGTLLVRGGKIAALGADTELPEGAKTVDCAGLVLAPGLVDMRAFASDPAAAARGGITSVTLMPDRDPPVDNQAMVEYVARKAAESGQIRAMVMGAATRGLAGAELAEIGLMREAGAVAFTDARKAVADTGIMRRLMEYATALDGLIVQFPEDAALAADGAMNEGEVATRLGLAGIPAAAETIMIERDLRLLEMTGGRYHVALVSCAASLEVIRRAKDQGLQVTCAVAPHHFALNETAVADYRSFARVSPPLRGEDDRAAMVEGIRDGTIDAICSDHDPRDAETKRLPFAQAAPGAVGFECMLPLALELTHNHDVPLGTIIRAMTCRPAEILDSDAGTLALGAPADFILIDPDRPWRIDAEKLASETRNTPFDGRPVQGRVMRSVLGGKTIFEFREK